MNIFSKLLIALLAASAFAGAAHAESITVAVASNMKTAFTELVADFGKSHPGDTVDAIYGASGKFATQIENGAPFDLFFSADTEYPQALAHKFLTAGKPQTYAIGHLVLWSLDPALGKTPLNALPRASIHTFAIANPQTAPYGRRAQEALQHEGAWDALQPKLVLGENISQTAQFIDTGAADVGIVALSLMLGPELNGKGAYTVIPDAWHQPLEQQFVILKAAGNKTLAKQFSTYVTSSTAKKVLNRYGFDAPK